MILHNSAQVRTSDELCNLFNLNGSVGVSGGVSPLPAAGEGMYFGVKKCICTVQHAHLEYYRTCANCAGCSQSSTCIQLNSPRFENEVVQRQSFWPKNSPQKCIKLPTKKKAKMVGHQLPLPARVASGRRHEPAANITSIRARARYMILGLSESCERWLAKSPCGADCGADEIV